MWGDTMSGIPTQIVVCIFVVPLILDLHILLVKREDKIRGARDQYFNNLALKSVWFLNLFGLSDLIV